MPVRWSTKINILIPEDVVPSAEHLFRTLARGVYRAWEPRTDPRAHGLQILGCKSESAGSPGEMPGERDVRDAPLPAVECITCRSKITRGCTALGGQQPGEVGSMPSRASEGRARSIRRLARV